MDPVTINSLLRIGQEALANVARPARSTKVGVFAGITGGSGSREWLALRVQDNGRGFDIDATNPASSMGLRNMRERAREIGATPGGIDGITTMHRLKREYPGIHVIALTASTDEARMQAVLRAGALGYVRKDADPELLVAAVHAVTRGRRFIAHSPDSAHVAVDLSPRELEVLRELAAGRSNREIAHRLAVSPATIKSHVANLLSKLQLPNRTALVAHAAKLGLLEPD